MIDSAFLSQSDRILPGTVETVAVPTPTVGNDWTVVVPGGEQWLVIAGTAKLTTSAVVATRFVGCRVTYATDVLYQVADNVGVAASLAPIVNYGVVSLSTVLGGRADSIAAPTPLFWLPPQTQLSSRTINIDVGDAYTQVRLWVQRVEVVNQQLVSHDMYEYMYDRERKREGQ